MKVHISQYSVGSQGLNISAIIIESWQSTISECQYGQKCCEDKPRAWHMACFACVVFILLQRSKICWFYCFYDTCVIIISQFNNSFFSTGLYNLWIYVPCYHLEFKFTHKNNTKISKYMKEVRKLTRWTEITQLSTTDCPSGKKSPIFVTKLFITLCKEAA